MTGVRCIFILVLSFGILHLVWYSNNFLAVESLININLCSEYKRYYCLPGYVLHPLDKVQNPKMVQAFSLYHCSLLFITQAEFLREECIRLTKCT